MCVSSRQRPNGPNGVFLFMCVSSRQRLDGPNGVFLFMCVSSRQRPNGPNGVFLFMCVSSRQRPDGPCAFYACTIQTKTDGPNGVYLHLCERNAGLDWTGPNIVCLNVRNIKDRTRWSMGVILRLRRGGPYGVCVRACVRVCVCVCDINVKSRRPICRASVRVQHKFKTRRSICCVSVLV